MDRRLSSLSTFEIILNETFSVNSFCGPLNVRPLASAHRHWYPRQHSGRKGNSSVPRGWHRHVLGTGSLWCCDCKAKTMSADWRVGKVHWCCADDEQYFPQTDRQLTAKYSIQWSKSHYSVGYDCQLWSASKRCSFLSGLRGVFKSLSAQHNSIGNSQTWRL